VWLALACVLLPSAARADGAMGLALATFAWGPWLAYVVVTVVFEAAAMGRWLRVHLAAALSCSLRANLLTALLGGFFSGIACVFIGFYGNEMNPNPFGRTLWLFTLFGSVSALVEASVWRRAVPNGAGPVGGATPRRRDVLARCWLVHLAGVPLGLAVLLLPARPYPGLEQQVYATRIFFFQQRQLRDALQTYVDDHRALPAARSYGELLQRLRPGLGRYADDPGLWAAAYVPDYRRFDTRERRRHPIEWNPRAGGYRLPDDPTGPLWLVRSRYFGGSFEGLVLEPGGWVKWSHNPQEFEDAAATARLREV